MAKNQEPDAIAFNRIVEGTTITGDINSNEGIRLDGKLLGNLITNGKLVVGVNGYIKGEVKCNNSDIEGKIEGKIFVNELLLLKSTAKIFGDITTNKLAVEPNAVFTGTCNMDSEQNNGSQEKSQEKIK